MNAQLERVRKRVVDDITTHKNLKQDISQKYREDKAKADGALDALFEILSDIDKQLDVPQPPGPA